jgi:predicted membrane protein
MAPAGIAVTVEIDVRASLESTFRTIVPIELAKIFRGFGPLPAVVGTRGQTGAWDHVGATRIVELADGSEAREELVAYEAPRHFAYRLSGFTGPLRLLVSYADGAWWFSDAGGGTTHVRWTYVFQPYAGRASLVRAALAPLWRRYERQALAHAASEAEQVQSAVTRSPPHGWLPLAAAVLANRRSCDASAVASCVRVGAGLR